MVMVMVGPGGVGEEIWLWLWWAGRAWGCARRGDRTLILNEDR